jgi:osmotically-inducible protein OsmY
MAFAVLALCATPVLAGPAATDQKPVAAPARDADNTAMNKRDSSNATTLPTDQSNAKSDLQVAAAVRKAITSDKSLSTLAHNVKVVTQNGEVTLRGPVKTADEKSRVAQLATNTAGVTRVNNELDIKQR